MPRPQQLLHPTRAALGGRELIARARRQVPVMPLAWHRYGMTMYDAPLQLAYDGLNPAARCRPPRARARLVAYMHVVLIRCCCCVCPRAHPGGTAIL